MGNDYQKNEAGNYTVFNIEMESNILIYEEAEQDDWM